MASQLTARGVATRGKILAAAAAEMHDHGVAGFTMDRVCERGGVSKSQLYHFVSSREALIQAVASTTVSDVLSLQTELFAGLTSLEGFRTWAKALVALQWERGGEGGCPIGTLHSQLDDHHRLAQLVLREGFDQWTAAIRNGLAAMQAAGELPASCDIDEQARLFLVAIQGGLLLTDAHRDPSWLEQALNDRLSALAALVAAGN